MQAGQHMTHIERLQPTILSVLRNLFPCPGRMPGATALSMSVRTPRPPCRRGYVLLQEQTASRLTMSVGTLALTTTLMVSDAQREPGSPLCLSVGVLRSGICVSR